MRLHGLIESIKEFIAILLIKETWIPTLQTGVIIFLGLGWPIVVIWMPMPFKPLAAWGIFGVLWLLKEYFRFRYERGYLATL